MTTEKFTKLELQNELLSYTDGFFVNNTIWDWFYYTNHLNDGNSLSGKDYINWLEKEITNFPVEVKLKYLIPKYKVGQTVYQLEKSITGCICVSNFLISCLYSYSDKVCYGKIGGNAVNESELFLTTLDAINYANENL